MTPQATPEPTPEQTAQQMTQQTAQQTAQASQPGLSVTHRRYVPYSHAHYAGNLVDGAYSLAAFGDVATEMCMRTDGDEGLFASYSDVQFRDAVRAGDVLEIRAELLRVGTRSRVMHFTAYVVARGSASAEQPGAAVVLTSPLLVTEATGTVVVPARPAQSV